MVRDRTPNIVLPVLHACFHQEPVYCGVFVKRQMGQKFTAPFCTWADSSTTGNVMETDAERVDADPFSVDLEALAEKTDRIRTETKVPTGP